MKDKNYPIPLEDIIANLPGHIYWKNKAGIILGCNTQQAIDAGFQSAQEIIGKTDEDMPWKDRAEEIRQNDNYVMTSGKAQTIEEFDYLSRKVPLKNNMGEIIGILGMSISVEEYRNVLEEDRQLLEEIVASMPGHVYWKDRDCILQDCNDQQAIDAGLPSRHDIVGKSAYDLLWQDQPENEKHKQAEITNQIDKNIMEANERSAVEEFVILPDGSTAYFLSEKVPLHNKEGDVVGLVGISFDITDRKRMEKELKKAKEEAEIANKLKTDFMRNMEHDIRTPLIGAYGLSEALIDEVKDTQLKKHLSDIANCTGKMLEYLDKLLDFSKIEQLSNPVFDQTVSLSDIFKSIHSIELPAAMHKKIKLETDFDSTIPAFVCADEYRVTSILINLVSNAIKFTDKGQVTFSAKLTKKGKKKINVTFSVEDTGIGIPEDKQDIIFEKFVRLSPSNKGLYSGQGLGLRIVKKFVDELHGNIDITSQVGKGTAFKITLPFLLPNGGSSNDPAMLKRPAES